MILRSTFWVSYVLSAYKTVIIKCLAISSPILLPQSASCQTPFKTFLRAASDNECGIASLLGTVVKIALTLFVGCVVNVTLRSSFTLFVGRMVNIALALLVGRVVDVAFRGGFTLEDS